MAKISKERRMKIVKMSKNKSRLRNSEFQEAESQKSSRCFKALKVFCIDLYGIIFESYNSGWKLIRIAKAQPKKTARQHELKRFTAAKKLALTKKYLKATKQQLYRYLPPITKTIQIRRTRHAGHGWRKLIIYWHQPLWQPVSSAGSILMSIPRIRVHLFASYVKLSYQGVVNQQKLLQRLIC